MAPPQTSQFKPGISLPLPLHFGTTPLENTYATLQRAQALIYTTEFEIDSLCSRVSGTHFSQLFFSAIKERLLRWIIGNVLLSNRGNLVRKYWCAVRRSLVDWFQVIQYIDFIKPDSSTGTGSSYYYSWIPADGFGDDEKAGHGTHTAGTAAGSTLNNPAETVECAAGETLSCVGACVDAVGSDDDLVTYYYQADDIDRQCPMFGCDDETEPCLGDDVATTLSENGGIAQGAKLAIFDVASDEDFLSDFAGNDLWEPCLEAGCAIHSGSFGSDGTCELGALDIVYDDFMYQVTLQKKYCVPYTSCSRLPTFLHVWYPCVHVLSHNHGISKFRSSTSITDHSIFSERCRLAMR